MNGERSVQCSGERGEHFVACSSEQSSRSGERRSRTFLVRVHSSVVEECSNMGFADEVPPSHGGVYFVSWLFTLRWRGTM